MMQLSKGRVAFEGLFRSLEHVISEWTPGNLSTEKQFKDSLLEHLRQHTPAPPACRIEPEYRDGGTTADLYLKWEGILFTREVFFELKQKLTKKTEFDRLVGQIYGLEPGKRRIMVVLCGETDPVFLGRLKELFREKLEVSPMIWWSDSEPAMSIVLKP